MIIYYSHDPNNKRQEALPEDFVEGAAIMLNFKDFAYRKSDKKWVRPRLLKLMRHRRRLRNDCVL